MKRIVFVFLALLLAFSLAACGSSQPSATEGNQEGTQGQEGQSSSEGSGDSGGDEVTLRIYWWGSQTRHDRTLEVIDMFQKEHPNIKIQPEFTGWDGYWQKLSANAAGNNMPDVLQMNYGEYMSQYSGKGLLADLTPFTEDGTIDVSKISESLISSGTVNDQLLGIPLGMNAPAVVYDPAKLEEAGVEEPDMNWTWDDYVEMATKVHEELGHYGTRNFEIQNVFVDYYVRQQGGHLFAQDGSPALGYEDQVLIDYLKLNNSLVESGVAAGLDVTETIQGVEDELIVHGKSAFDFRWSNQVDALSNAAQKPLKLITFPGPDVEKGMYLKPAMFFSISKTSEHKKEAAMFINYFINNIDAAKVLGTDRGVPVSSDIREQLLPELNETQKQTFDFISMVAENSSPIDKPFPNGSAEILKKLEDINAKVEYGELTPEEAAAQFREEAEAILEREN